MGKGFFDKSGEPDNEVSRQAEHKAKILEQDRKAKENFVAVDSWYELPETPGGQKIIKKVRQKNGNVQSIFVGMVRGHEDHVRDLKEQGKVRARV